MRSSGARPHARAALPALQWWDQLRRGRTSYGTPKLVLHAPGPQTPRSELPSSNEDQMEFRYKHWCGRAERGRTRAPPCRRYSGGTSYGAGGPVMARRNWSSMRQDHKPQPGPLDKLSSVSPGLNYLTVKPSPST